VQVDAASPCFDKAQAFFFLKNLIVWRTTSIAPIFFRKYHINHRKVYFSTNNLKKIRVSTIFFDRVMPFWNYSGVFNEYRPALALPNMYREEIAGRTLCIILVKRANYVLFVKLGTPWLVTSTIFSDSLEWNVLLLTE